MAGAISIPSGGKTARVVTVIAVVAAAMTWGLFLHEPAPSEADRPAFLTSPDEPLPAPADAQPYEVTATLESNYPKIEELTVVRQRVVFPGEVPVVKDTQLSTGEGPLVQKVAYRHGDKQFVRSTYNDETEFRSQLDDTRPVQVDETSLTYYSVGETDHDVRGIEPRRALQGLYLLRYEQVGTTTYHDREAIRYEPVTGWTTSQTFDSGDSSQSIYVRQATGEVLVDAETGAILSANVSGSFITADSWAGVMTDDSYSVTVTYRTNTSIDQPSEPPWVDTLRDSSNETVEP